MKKIITIVSILIFATNIYAQNVKTNIESDVELVKIDKNTDLAFVYNNGNLVEKGILKNGKREGVWQSFKENGTLLTEASFSNGEKNGVWVIYDQAEVKYVLHYQNNVRVKASDLAIAQ